MIEWQATVKRAYDLGQRLLGASESKKRFVRLAFGTHALQLCWDKEDTMELRVSEPGVEETQTTRLILRPADKQYVNSVVVTRPGQAEEELKALLDELLEKWQLAEGKLSN